MRSQHGRVGGEQSAITHDTSPSSTMMQQLLSGLKSRSDESRLLAAKELQHYVSTELREASAEQYTGFMDELNHQIFEMVSSSDTNEKKGGIMAIGGFCLRFDRLRRNTKDESFCALLCTAYQNNHGPLRRYFSNKLPVNTFCLNSYNPDVALLFFQKFLSTKIET